MSVILCVCVRARTCQHSGPVTEMASHLSCQITSCNQPLQATHVLYHSDPWGLRETCYLDYTLLEGRDGAVYSRHKAGRVLRNHLVKPPYFSQVKTQVGEGARNPRLSFPSLAQHPFSSTGHPCLPQCTQPPLWLLG